jgi:hypothetical protein
MALEKKLFDAIQGNQHLPSELVKGVQAALRRRDRIGKHRIKSFQHARNEHVANMTVMH